MKIAIFGASGTIGQRITLEALERGHEVIALSRRATGFPIAHSHLHVVQVDILDPASVAQAIRDADVVVNATSGRASADVHEFYIRSTQSTIEGVKQAGDKRLLVVGGAGSLEIAPGTQLVDTPDFPAAWRPGASAQRDTLALYRVSDIDWTFFSPSALIAPGRRTGNYRLGTDYLLTNEQGESYISAEDYAVALLDEIEHPQFLRKRFTAVSLEK
ncbi:MAG TPA: NAD(P)-dependent oxidoreductase [Ktedonobacteraceae bacterium]|nr:NAD(P)-dependent oxidoreductase [Ktedonobacteraceae bacterium]